MIAVLVFVSECYCNLSYAARNTVIFLTTHSTFFISLLRLFQCIPFFAFPVRPTEKVDPVTTCGNT